MLRRTNEAVLLSTTEARLERLWQYSMQQQQLLLQLHKRAQTLLFIAASLQAHLHAGRLVLG